MSACRFAAITLSLLVVCAACSEDSTDESSWTFDEAVTEPAPDDVEPGDGEEPKPTPGPTPGPSPEPGPRPEPAPDPEPVPAPEPRLYPEAMTGLWLIDQPYHALYEATWYDFRPDGELIEVTSESFGHEVPTGTVGRCDEWSPQNDDHCADFDNAGECRRYYDPYCTRWADVACAFADRWWSPRAGMLSILGECGDGQMREIVFDVDTLLDGQAEAPRVVSVGGEEGWHHNMWDWRWLKCSEAEDVDDCHMFSP